MSRHHRRQKHSTHAPGLRKLIAMRLPAKCLDCPHPVLPEHQWQVGHIVAAMDDGQLRPSNVGPSHAWCPACRKRCNQSAGGKRGAAIVNAARAGRSRAARGLRPW